MNESRHNGHIEHQLYLHAESC